MAINFHPSLRYSLYGLDLEAAPIVGDGPTLFAVYEAQASRWKSELRVTVRGPMRTRAGRRGPSRHKVVDLSVPQPSWLESLIDDARGRLFVGGRW